MAPPPIPGWSDKLGSSVLLNGRYREAVCLSAARLRRSSIFKLLIGKVLSRIFFCGSVFSRTFEYYSCNH